MQKKSTPLLVVAVALLDEEDHVLMQRRRYHAEHGGLWEFPGGKVEAGESAESAAVREIEEELALTLDEGALEPLTFASGAAATPSVNGSGLVLLLYTCRHWQEQPQCRDSEEIGWFAPGELASLAMPPLDYPLARALVSRMQQKFA